MNETPNNQDDPLYSALRKLAEADAQTEAAPRVESALLTAFRKQHQPQVVVERVESKTASQPLFAISRWSVATSWQPKWRYGLAAVALLLMGFTWWNWRAASGVSTPEQFVATQSPTPAPTQSLVREPIEATNPVEVIEKEALPVAQLVAHRKPEVRRIKPSKPSRPLVEEEIATEFFPLVTTNALPERGRMVRVKVPRSTLINFGLPVNAERTEIPINADLLIGEDGAARAIRFVQDQYSSGRSMNNGFNDYGGRPLPAAYRNPR